MIQSVERAIDILGVIHGKPDGSAGLVEIAKALNLEKSTVFNLIKTLKARGFVVQEKQGEKYSLGPELLRLTSGNLNAAMLDEKLMPFCMEIREKTNESVSIVTYASAELKIICRLLSDKAVNAAPNSFKPLYATASGRCILAQLPETEIDGIIDIYGFPEGVWDGISNRAALEKELEKIRKEKIITVISEEREVVAIGAIIDAPEKYAPLAIGLFLPLYRFASARRSSFIKLIKEYTNKISLYLNKQN